MPTSSTIQQVRKAGVHEGQLPRASQRTTGQMNRTIDFTLYDFLCLLNNMISPSIGTSLDEVIYTFRAHEPLDLPKLSVAVHPAEGVSAQLSSSTLGTIPSSMPMLGHHRTPLDAQDTIASATATVKHQ